MAVTKGHHNVALYLMKFQHSTSSDYSKLLFVYILKLVWFLVLLMLRYCVVLLFTYYYSLPSNVFYLFEFSAQYFIVVEHGV